MIAKQVRHHHSGIDRLVADDQEGVEGLEDLISQEQNARLENV